MTGYTLEVRTPAETLRIDRVVSFVGEDASGSFGLRTGHTRFATILVSGLGRFCTHRGDWQYLALPGGVLSFAEGRLCICTRRYLLDSDYLRVSGLLATQFAAEQQLLRSAKQSLRRMEETLLWHLWELDKETI